MKCPRRPRSLEPTLVESAWIAQFNAYLISRYGGITLNDMRPPTIWFSVDDSTHPSPYDMYVATRRTNGQ